VKKIKISLEKSVLAFLNQSEYDEYYWPSIYANPRPDTMLMLKKARIL